MERAKKKTQQEHDGQLDFEGKLLAAAAALRNKIAAADPFFNDSHRCGEMLRGDQRWVLGIAQGGSE